MLLNRHIEIVIRNFDSKQEFVVSSDQGFRIDFDYSEYLDQSSSSNTGSVKIYNLSIETFEKIGKRFSTEVEIICGYKNEQTNTVDRLCIGGLTSKSRSRDGANWITTLEFQTAIKQVQASKKISRSFKPKTKLLEAMGVISDDAGLTFSIKIDPIDLELYGEDLVAKIERTNFPFGASFCGTPKQIFDQISEFFSWGWMIDPKEPTHIIWTMHEKGLAKLDIIKDSLQTGNSTPTNVKIEKMDTHTQALVLSLETGMIDSPYVETVELNTSYYEALDDNEEIVSKKEIVPKRNKKGEILKDKKGNVKMTKVASKKIARVVVNAKSLINPQIKPNSWIRLLHTINNVDGFYRVRNIKYNGSTHEEQGFIMEMTLTLMRT